MYVQFSDNTETVVIAIFGCPQDATVYQNQADIPATDPRYVTFLSALPSISQAGWEKVQ
jgi:hypothetical protein